MFRACWGVDEITEMGKGSEDRAPARLEEMQAQEPAYSPTVIWVSGL